MEQRSNSTKSNTFLPILLKKGCFFRTEDYEYRSGADYAGEKELLEGICVFQNFKLYTPRKVSLGSGG